MKVFKKIMVDDTRYREIIIKLKEALKYASCLCDYIIVVLCLSIRIGLIFSVNAVI